MTEKKETRQGRSRVLPGGEAPRRVRRFLERVGGTNPHGEPNYRIVIAEFVQIYRGNNWHDWPKNTRIQDQGGLVFSEERKIVRTVVPDVTGGKHELVYEAPAEVAVSHQQPLRIVSEMRWIRRYPHLNGWVLQHWDPPYLYGSRAEWESHRVPGATHLLSLGEFPNHGDYEISCEWCDPQKGFQRLGGLPELPPLSILETAIQQREARRHEQLSANPEWRHLTRMLEWQEQQEAEERKNKESLQKYYRDIMKPYMASSLESGRLREQLANRARARGVELGHVGN